MGDLEKDWPMKTKEKSLLRDESGQALILTALCVVCVMGFLGLALDVGILCRDKVNLQKIADDAAVAAAAQLRSGNYTAAARASAAQNRVTSNSTVTATLGTTYHPNAVSVLVSQPESTVFMGLFGYKTVKVSATGVAQLTGGNACIYALDTNPFKGQGILMNGTGNLAVNCQIYDNADLVTDGSSGSITASQIGVAGSYSGGDASPTPITGIVAVADPMAYWTTPPAYSSCVKDPNLSSGTVTPNCYQGLTLSGTATLSPGLYVIDGTLSLNGVTASGVSFYIDGMQKGSFGSMDGSNLTAPTTGTSGTCTSSAGCNGILIWDTEVSGKQGIAIGPQGATLSGILYFPKSSLKFHGYATTTLNAVLVTLSYTFDGTVNISSYVLGSGQAPILTAATLVE